MATSFVTRHGFTPEMEKKVLSSSIVFFPSSPCNENGSFSLQLQELYTAQGIPLGRVGSGEDIAEVIAFLADRHRSGFILGQTIIADGGSTLVTPTSNMDLGALVQQMAGASCNKA